MTGIDTADIRARWSTRIGMPHGDVSDLCDALDAARAELTNWKNVLGVADRLAAAESRAEKAEADVQYWKNAYDNLAVAYNDLRGVR